MLVHLSNGFVCMLIDCFCVANEATFVALILSNPLASASSIAAISCPSDMRMSWLEPLIPSAIFMTSLCYRSNGSVILFVTIYMISLTFASVNVLEFRILCGGLTHSQAYGACLRFAVMQHLETGEFWGTFLAQLDFGKFLSWGMFFHPCYRSAREQDQPKCHWTYQ